MHHPSCCAWLAPQQMRPSNTHARGRHPTTLCTALLQQQHAMTVHAALLASPTCRVCTARPAQAARSKPFRGATADRLRPLRPLRAAQVTQVGAGQAGMACVPYISALGVRA